MKILFQSHHLRRNRLRRTRIERFKYWKRPRWTEVIWNGTLTASTTPSDSSSQVAPHITPPNTTSTLSSEDVETFGPRPVEIRWSQESEVTMSAMLSIYDILKEGPPSCPSIGGHLPRYHHMSG